jgi:hypothetical protein
MIAFKNEIDGYKTTITNQFKQIMELEKIVNHLNNLNAVKYESYKQRAERDLLEIKKEIQMKEESILLYHEFIDDKLEDISMKEKTIKILSDINNEIRNRHIRKCNFIDQVLKDQKYSCCICYEQITLDNIVIPKCHVNHYICSSCVLRINKCPLCKDKY